ncbi:MAG: dihydrofolate reductase [Candidatus Moraniibacteriota bacterium]
MSKPKISLICACSENRVIGSSGKTPWKILQDLQNFKRLTLGHVVIVGRKTFESIGKVLPGRINIIVTKDQDFKAQNCFIARSIELAIAKACELEREEIFICGGGSVYAQTIGMADKLYLTVVEGDFEGDVFFPPYEEFSKIVSQRKSQDENFKFTFLELEK